MSDLSESLDERLSKGCDWICYGYKWG